MDDNNKEDEGGQESVECKRDKIINPRRNPIPVEQLLEDIRAHDYHRRKRNERLEEPCCADHTLGECALHFAVFLR